MTIGKKRGPKPKCSDEQVCKALEKHRGLVRFAAKDLSISRKVLYDYINRSEKIRAAKELAHDDGLDRAERKLFDLIEDGNMTAIIFFLKCQAKARGYVERTEVANSFERPVEFTLNLGDRTVQD